MIGGQPAGSDLLLPPIRVVARQSTQMPAIDDPEVASAPRFIREHAHRPIGVPDVVKQATINRRWLEIRFRQQLGRTILQEIRRVRMEHAKRLLAETDLGTAQIARTIGLASASRLAVVFAKEAGLSPSAYRAQFRMRPGGLAPND